MWFSSNSVRNCNVDGHKNKKSISKYLHACARACVRVSLHFKSSMFALSQLDHYVHCVFIKSIIFFLIIENAGVTCVSSYIYICISLYIIACVCVYVSGYISHTYACVCKCSRPALHMPSCRDAHCMSSSVPVDTKPETSRPLISHLPLGGRQVSLSMCRREGGGSKQEATEVLGWVGTV